MHIGFQYVGVHLDLKRHDGRAAFFCEHLASGGGDARIDLLEQLVIEPGDVVPQGLMAEDFGFLAPRRGGHAQHLAHEGIVVGDMFQAIPVRVQTQAHDAQHQNLPEVHAGAAGGLLARQDGGFQQTENLGPQRRMHPEPLQPGQDRRQLVPAPGGQANLFDGRDLKIGLGLKGMAHGGKRRRMLRGQTPKSPQTFNHHANIRTNKPTPISMMARRL